MLGLSHCYRRLLKVAGRICRVVPGCPVVEESNPNPGLVGLWPSTRARSNGDIHTLLPGLGGVGISM